MVLALFLLILFGQIANPMIRAARYRASPRVAEFLFAVPFVGFFLPFYIGLFWVDLPLSSATWFVIAGLFAGLMIRCSEFSKVARLVRAIWGRPNNDVPGMRVVFHGYQTLMSAISQEVFYRGVVFAFLAGAPFAAIAVVSTILFVSEHAANRWAHHKYGVRDYLRLAALSLFWCGLTAASGSLLPALLSHVAYNAFAQIPLCTAWLRNTTARHHDAGRVSQ
ncbi:CPBP family intramembrane glutamic endopeptidase [Yoonia maricola]|nr:CPBP family intramembrane glutamic endopeptidase [Yoonia maricola]